MTPPDAAAAETGAEIADDILARAPYRDLSGRLGDLHAAYAVQAAAVERLALTRGPVAGRKIAWNTDDQMQALGLSEPGAGRVLKGQIAASPARLDAAGYAAFVIEPEFAAVLSAPLAPRRGGHDRASVAAAIGRIVPAFELMDRRGEPFGGPLSMIAANIFNAGLVLGGPGLPPQDVDPAALRSVVTVNGETVLDRAGAAPMHPLDSVVFLANRFNALGETLEAGEILLLGAHLPPRPIEAPAEVRFEIGGLGEASFAIA